jgi:chemotaxis protein CheX
VKAQVINPFLESAQMVIKQVINVTPTRGKIEIKDVEFFDHHIWILIGMNGHMSGDIVFGIHEVVALRLISAMMGGMEINEIDEIGKSAISELSNMISGNASTILSNQGVHIDITPPELLDSSHTLQYKNARALVVPLNLGDIGTFDIRVIVK